MSKKPDPYPFKMILLPEIYNLLPAFLIAKQEALIEGEAANDSAGALAQLEMVGLF